MKKNLLKRDGVQSLIASLLCVVLGLLIGYIVLLIINPAGAGEAISTVIKNFLTYKKPETQMKYFGNTLVRTAPLLMCSLSILFAYKAGLFNIGAAGQYCAGAGMALYAALAWHMPWWLCMIMAMLGGALLGVISGLLKSYCNVNEVISGIMLNWITLYVVNILLTNVKEAASPYTPGAYVYAALSEDGGARFGKDGKAQDSFGDAIAQWHAAVAGNRRGDLVIAFDDERDGTADIWLTRLTPAGWGENHTPPAASGPGRQTDPAIALDESGHLHLAWIDRSDDGATRLRYTVIPPPAR